MIQELYLTFGVTDQNNIFASFDQEVLNWPTEILMPFLSFSDNVPQDADIIKKKNVDYFEIAHKTCLILV